MILTLNFDDIINWILKVQKKLAIIINNDKKSDNKNEDNDRKSKS